MEDHKKYMHRCLQLAKLGQGRVAPNPMVGAVLVHQGIIIGEGWHQQFGEAHAEVNCFHSVPSHLKKLIPESTLYVSLEPCAHHGKTPPCANRIVQEQVKKVVVGMQDPFARVNGKGIEIMRENGIEVVVPVLEQECRDLNKRFILFHEKHRPYIHLKWAATADGYLTAPGGFPIRISHPLADRLVHQWRSKAAAIMVGTQTAMVDDPTLNNRHWFGNDPIRIIPDRMLRIPASHQIIADGKPTMILNSQVEKTEGAVQYLLVKDWERAGIAGMVEVLYQHQIQSILVEGGTALLQSFIKANLWDEAHVIINKTLKSGAGVAAPILQGTVHNYFELGNNLITEFRNP